MCMGSTLRLLTLYERASSCGVATIVTCAGVGSSIGSASRADCRCAAACFVVFDLLARNGVDLRTRPSCRRRTVG